MAEYSRLAKGSLTSTGGTMKVNLPFAPDYIELKNFTAAHTPATGGIPSAVWDVNMGQGAAQYDVFNATPVLTTATTTTNGFSTFDAGLMLQYGPPQQVVSIAKGSYPTVTVTAHGLTTGDTVIFEGLYQTPTTGMIQLCGPQFNVTVLTADTFSIFAATGDSNYTAISGSPAGAVMKKVLYPYLYSPYVCYVQNVTTAGNQTNIYTTNAYPFVVGQEVAFRIPALFGTVELNSLPNNVTPGSPIYAYVTAIVGPNQFVVNVNSTNFTPFNLNPPFAAFTGQSFPQVVAVGDVNSGGTPYSGGNLYPSPSVNGVPTINGPAISGAFINNTSQGFVIGSTVSGASGNALYWRALLHDYSNP